MANQTQMETMNGNTPALDGDGIIDNISYMRNVTAKAVDYTVKAEESGTLFTTEGATAAVNFTLPANADGLEFWFIAAEDVEIMVTAGDVDTLVTHNDVAADTVAFTTSSEHVGSGFICISDGSKWMVFTMASNDGTNAAQLTVTT